MLLSRKDLLLLSQNTHNSEEHTLHSQTTAPICFLETHAAYAAPSEGKMEVWSSSQDLAATQVAVAAALVVPQNKVNAIVRRAGGGYGGKLAGQLPAACATAICATLFGCRVRAHNERVDDMTMMGGRSPMTASYTAAYDPTTMVISALELKLNYASGCTVGGIGDASMGAGWADGAYATSKYACWGTIRRQPHQGNTSCRAPGNIASIAAHEVVLEHVAAELGVLPELVREANLYAAGDKTPGGDEIGSATFIWSIPALWANAKASDMCCCLTKCLNA